MGPQSWSVCLGVNYASIFRAENLHCRESNISLIYLSFQIFRIYVPPFCAITKKLATSQFSRGLSPEKGKISRPAQGPAKPPI